MMPVNSPISTRLKLTFPWLSQRDPWPFTIATAHWGKGNNQNFQGLLDTGSELTLIQRDPKHQRSTKVGAYGGQVNNGVLAQICSMVGPVDPKPILWLFL